LHPEFFEAFTRAKSAQLGILIEGAMAGTYHPQFAQFAAINLHNWHSRHEVSGPDSKPLVVPENASRRDVAMRAAFLISQALHYAEDQEG
jgi:hypothetical protein